MANILITGGTGLIGKILTQCLLEKGHDVAILSRFPKSLKLVQHYHWDTSRRIIDVDALKSSDYIIHLAGANIADKRWTQRRKRDILESRVKSTEFLFEMIREHYPNLKGLISASAIGIYGAINSDKILNENDAHCDDYLGNVCYSWENAVDKFQTIGIRTVTFRTGVVLTKSGGALSKMIGSLKFGVGIILGTGRQYLPWIHVDDLCELYKKAIEDCEMSGTYNAVSPEHITYEKFVEQAIGISNKRIFRIRIPSIILKIALGQMSEMLLKGSRVSPEKLVKSGFNFKYPTLAKALKDLLIEQ